MDIIGEVIATIVSAITEFGSAAVTSIVTNFQTLVWVPETVSGSTTVPGHLTAVAVWGLVFMGISLVIGLGSLVFNTMRNKG